MANQRTGWSPRNTLNSWSRKRFRNPNKIEAAENYARSFPAYNDNGAMRLNDTENGEGISPIKKKNQQYQRYSDAIRNMRNRKGK